MTNIKKETQNNKQSHCDMKEEHPYSLEQLNARLEHVNRWIENCDQKVYILLAFIGACITVFVSSSLFLKARNVLVQPFYAYIENNDAYCFSLRNFLLFIGLFPICYYSCRMISYFLKVLTPKTITSEFLKENPTLEGHSLLHFQTISKMKFEAFESDVMKDIEERYKHDLCSQIFINSAICDAKFKNFKNGLNALRNVIVGIALEAIVAFFLPSHYEQKNFFPDH